MSTQHIMDMWERQIREEGIRQGMERALANAQQIREEGIRQGMERALASVQQIREEGIRGMERALATARHSILRLYQARFGSASNAMRERIAATSDLDLLERWIDLVAEGAREEVDQALGSG